MAKNLEQLHYHRKVQEFLDTTFSGRWLGCCGPLVWAPRSPDLTPLDFFAWGHLKNAVYERKLVTIDDLINFINEEAHKITTNMCQKVIQCFHRRLHTCVKNGGSLVKKY